MWNETVHRADMARTRGGTTLKCEIKLFTELTWSRPGVGQSIAKCEMKLFTEPTKCGMKLFTELTWSGLEVGQSVK